MFRIPFYILLLSFTFLIAQGFSNGLDDLGFSGYLEKRGCYSIKDSNQLQASEILFRGEIRKVTDTALLFASTDIMDNEFSDDVTKLHEAYIDYSYKSFNARIGKQIIIWGSSDGLRVTDNISPVDSSEFITRSFDETRMGLNALNLSYNEINYSLNFLIIPVFKEAKTPDKDSPWYVGDKDSSYITKETIPDKDLGNMEFGSQVKFYLPGIDFSLSYFLGFSDNPVSYFEENNSDEVLIKSYKKEEIFGLNFSKPIKDFVIRGESAYFRNIHINSNDSHEKPLESDLIKWIIGADYYPGNSFNLSLQVYFENLLSNKNKTIKDELTNVYTLSISKKLFREKLNISSMIFYNWLDKDSYINFSWDYEVSNHIKISSGLDLFMGKKSTLYGQYNDNSQVFFRLKYSF